MKKLKLYLVTIAGFSSFFIIGCSFKHELKLIKGKPNYKLHISEKYTLVQTMQQNAEINEARSEARLKDGSVIYITDDLKGTYDLDGYKSEYKVEKYGKDYRFNYYTLADTATLNGIHSGKYWREKKYYYIIVGYYDASAKEKTEYDAIIDAIVPQVDALRKKRTRELNGK